MAIEPGKQFATSTPVEKFADEIEDSLVVEHSPVAEASRTNWVDNSVWPKDYLKESLSNPGYQEMLQSNLKRMGFGNSITVRRRGPVTGPIVNAGIGSEWSGKVHGEGDLHEWEVSPSDIVGFGHPNEGEVFVRLQPHHNIRKVEE